MWHKPVTVAELGSNTASLFKFLKSDRNPEYPVFVLLALNSGRTEICS